MNRRATIPDPFNPANNIAGDWVWIIIHVNGEYKGGVYRCLVCGHDDMDGFAKGCNA